MSEQDLGKEVLANVLPSKSEDGFVSPHTPTPWVVQDETGEALASGIAPSGWVEFGYAPFKNLGSAYMLEYEQNKANAHFLVRACNAHDDLLAALQACLKWHVDLVNSGDAGFWDPEDDDCVKQARAAISRARDALSRS